MLIKLNVAVCSSFLRHSLTSFCLILLGLERIPGFYQARESRSYTRRTTDGICSQRRSPAGYMGCEEMYVRACELYGCSRPEDERVDEKR